MHKGLVWVCIVTAGLLAGCGGGGGGGGGAANVGSNPSIPSNSAAACAGTQCTSFSGVVNSGPGTLAPAGTTLTGTNPANGTVCAGAVTTSAGDYVMALTELATNPQCANVSGLLVAAPSVHASTTCYIGQATPCNLSPATAAQIASFAGTWSASYTSSGDQGTCAIVVVSSGAVQQANCTSTTSGQAFKLSGVLTPSSTNPSQGIFAGTATTGATYQGTFVLSQGGGSVSNGTWSNTATNISGTWTATLP